MSTKTETTTRVREVMTREPVCVDAGSTIRELARLFEEEEISGAPVVAGDGRLMGVVSNSDLIRRCSQGTPDAPPGYLFELLSDEADEADEDRTTMPEPLIVVEDFMSWDPVTCAPDELISAVAHRMAEVRIHRIVVVDKENFPVGIVTSLDLLRVFPD